MLLATAPTAPLPPPFPNNMQSASLRCIYFALRNKNDELLVSRKQAHARRLAASGALGHAAFISLRNAFIANTCMCCITLRAARARLLGRNKAKRLHAETDDPPTAQKCLPNRAKILHRCCYTRFRKNGCRRSLPSSVTAAFSASDACTESRP